MTARRALVTGATGFIGSHLVGHLFKAGWRVEAIVRPDSDRSLLSDVKACRVHEHTGSTASMQAIIADAQPDVVFHLASLFLSEHQPEDVERLIQSNLLFGTQLVEAMTKMGVTALVNTGTAWQHYQSCDYSPVNLYAATKQAFETLLHYYIEARRLRVITLELPDTYGPDDPRRKLLNLLRHAARDNAELGMSPGDQEIDLVHVSDVVTAYTCAAGRMLTSGAVKHEKFSVSSGGSVSLRELVRLCEQEWGIQLKITWGQKPYRTREVMKPRQGPGIPGWSPRISLRDGLRNFSTLVHD